MLTFSILVELKWEECLGIQWLCEGGVVDCVKGGGGGLCEG